MAVGDAGTFYPIRPPAAGDSVAQVAEDAWCSALAFPLLPADSMSSNAAATLLQSFARFLVGGIAQLGPQVAAQLVLVQTPLSLADVAAAYQDASRALAASAPGASNIAWIWSQHIAGLEAGGLARRTGAVVLTARPTAPSLGTRLRGGMRASLGRDDAMRLLAAAVRLVRDAASDVGFALSLMAGNDLAGFLSLWTRGEALPLAGEEAVDPWGVHGER